jgi:predicted alpha/beta-fold hydrolase
MSLLNIVYLLINSLGITTERFQNLCVIFVILFIIYQVYFNFSVINKVVSSYSHNPILFKNEFYKEGISIEEFINKNIPEFRNNSISIFNPFLFNGHLQTMFAGIRRFRFVDQLYFQRQIRTGSDGGSFALDHVISKEKFEKYEKLDLNIPKEQPKIIDKFTRYMTTEELENQHSDDSKAIIIALTGLSGSSAESYIRCLFNRLSTNDEFDLYVLNSRGCGNCNLSTPRLFCALWTEDIRSVIKFFKKNFPNRKIYLFGVSLGSIVMLNYLGQEGENSNVTLAIAFGSIWDLRGSSYFLENGLISKLCYSTTMTFPLLNLLKGQSSKLLEDPVFKNQYTEEILKSVWLLKDFDNAFTSKLFGFTCADHYYHQASPINRIFKIKTPLINISALDDPITGGLEIGSLPIDQAKFSPFISMVNTTLGGHVGYFKWNNVRWYADPLSKFLIKFHENIASKDEFEILVDPKHLTNDVLDEDMKLTFQKLQED